MEKAKGGKAFRDRYELAGDSLKRPPQGYDKEHPLLEDLKRKDFIAVQQLDHDELFTPELVNSTMANFRAAKGFMGFLCGAVGVKF